MYPDLKDINVRMDGTVAVIELDRPNQRNAFTNTMKDSLIAAYGRLDRDDAVKVILLTGAPNAGNAFCAGADLSQGDFSSSDSGRTARDNARRNHNTARNLNEHRDGGGQTTLAAISVSKPTICAVNGHAVGIGITMTLPFDIRLAWKDAKIGFVFGKRGIVPEAASSYFLPKLIGHSRALELFMTARIQPASSPTLDLLFSSLHPTPEATVTAALALAHEIASSNSMISMAVTKALVWRGCDNPEDQHLLDSKAMHVTGNAQDSKEGVQSFKDKRPAQFNATLPKDLPTELYPWWSIKDVRSKL